MVEEDHGMTTFQGQTITRLLEQGIEPWDVATKTKASIQLVRYYANKLGIEVPPRPYQTKDWPAVQAYLDQGHTTAEASRQFKISPKTIGTAVRNGNLKATRRPVGFPKLTEAETIAAERLVAIWMEFRSA